MSALSDIFFDYTLRTVALGAATLGIVSGVLGAFAVLRRISLLGDAISHAALPGVALAFMLTLSKDPVILIAGALVAGWLGTIVVMLVTRYTRIPQDAALGVVLSVFFGFGLVLLGFIQRLPTSNKAGLDKFLFGQAATLMQKDIITMAVFGAAALLCVLLLWKEFKMLSFDPEYAGTLGYPVQRLELLLTALTVVAIVIGLQTVGVVLMSAMLVAPAAAARQWTQRLGIMTLLSGLFGAIAGVLGALISAQVGNLPTGPTIVLVMSALVCVSLLCAPRRGIIARLILRARQRVQFAVDALLVHLLHHEGLPEEEDEARLGHFVSDLRWSRRFLQRIVRVASRAGYITQRGNVHLALTPAGREVAQRAMLR